MLRYDMIWYGMHVCIECRLHPRGVADDGGPCVLSLHGPSPRPARETTRAVALRAFALRAEGAAVADHHVAATFASLVYGCISAKATTCANTYGEAVVPIHKKRD